MFVWFLFPDFVAWALLFMQTCSCTPTAAVFLFLKWVTVLFCRWSCFRVRRRKKSRTTSTTYIVRELHSLSGCFCVLKERRILQHILQLSWKLETKQKKFVNLPSTPIFRYNIQKGDKLQADCWRRRRRQRRLQWVCLCSHNLFLSSSSSSSSLIARCLGAVVSAVLFSYC